MLNTPDFSRHIKWLDLQESFIESLEIQPVIAVVRPLSKDLKSRASSERIISLISDLYEIGLRNIEVAWIANQSWGKLISEIKSSFPKIFLGAASITSKNALIELKSLNLKYSMSPIWNQELQEMAYEINQILIPGVLTPSEIHYAKSFGWKVIKIFPASIFGSSYLNQLQIPISPMPFSIAAGGLGVQDIDEFLSKGYGAITLGRSLFKNHEINPLILDWLKNKNIY